MPKTLTITIRVTDTFEDSEDPAEFMTTAITPAAQAVINVEGYALGGYIESWKVS